MVDLQKKTATLAVNRTVHVTRCVDEMIATTTTTTTTLCISSDEDDDEEDAATWAAAAAAAAPPYDVPPMFAHRPQCAPVERPQPTATHPHLPKNAVYRNYAYFPDDCRTNGMRLDGKIKHTTRSDDIVVRDRRPSRHLLNDWCYAAAHARTCVNFELLTSSSNCYSVRKRSVDEERTPIM